MNPPAYVAWRAGTITLFLAPKDCSSYEPVFLNVYGAQELTPRTEFRQPP